MCILFVHLLLFCVCFLFLAAAPVVLKLFGANKHFACSAKGQHTNSEEFNSGAECAQDSIFEGYHHHYDFSAQATAIIRHRT
jgi:hypothetical protein